MQPFNGVATLGQLNEQMCGGPGLVVMGGDSRSKGSEFKSQHCILDEHFIAYICCKKCLFV